MSLTTPTPAPTTPAWWRWVNPIAIWLLRSPFHPLISRMALVLTVTGRQSGRRYTFPVCYIREGDTLLVLTGSRWWRNLRGGAPIELCLQGRTVAGRAEVSTHSEEVEQAILAHLRQMPFLAREFQLRLDRYGQPDPARLKQAAQSGVLVTIRVGSHAG